MRLIIQYWSRPDVNKISPKHVFVGDVHGDLHQFLAPLVTCNILHLTGKICTVKHDRYTEADIHYPEYELVNNPPSTVVFLGDMVDEWIFGRTIIYMLLRLLRESENVRYVFGNHDVSILGRYPMWLNESLDIPNDLPGAFHTAKKELSCLRNVNVYGKHIEYNRSEDEGKMFLREYFRVYFETLYALYTESLGELCIPLNVNGTPFIVSHSTWTRNALKCLSEGRSRLQLDVPPCMREMLNPAHKTSSDSHTVVQKYIASEPNSFDDYVELCEACNDLFYGQSALYVTINHITYTRITNGLFVNQITGHTFGGEWADANVNVEPSKTHNERVQKLRPTIIDGKRIYYFDFGCSAGYNTDEVSCPDYAYYSDGSFGVSDLPQFMFEESHGKFVMRCSPSKRIHVDRKEICLTATSSSSRDM